MSAKEPEFRRFKVAMATRYPAQSGGTAARAYWSARKLARRGHEIHIVTDAPAPSKRSSRSDPLPELVGEGGSVTVHRLPPFDPSVVLLQADPHLERLVGHLADVVEREGCELIDARFLVPYGVAGYFASMLTGRPFVLRHAINDINRLWPSEALKPTLDRVVRSASAVLTQRTSFPRWKKAGVPESRLHVARFGLDHQAFRPEAEPIGGAAHLLEALPKGVPVVLHDAKLSAFADTDRLLLALSTLRTDDFALLVLVPEVGQARIAEQAAEYGMEPVLYFAEPVVPWEMPGLLREATVVVYPSYGNRVPHRSHLVRQAMATGTVVVTADEVAEDLSEWLGETIIDGEHLVTYEAGEPGELAHALRRVLRGSADARVSVGTAARELSLRCEQPEKAVKRVEAVYGSVVGD